MPQRRPQLVVRRGAALLAVLYVVYGGLIYAVHAIAAASGAVVPVTMTTTSFIAAGAAGAFALALVHETGHVLAYRALGLRWERLTIARTLSVRASDPRDFQSQLFISAAGPLLQAAAGAALFAVAQSPWSLLGLLGVVGLVEGLGNLLVPLSRNADATKIYRALWAIVRGRRHHVVNVAQ